MSRPQFLKMTVSTTLESFLRSRQLACRGSSGGNPPQYLARLEEALQEWRETTGCSVTAIAKELRAMGLNLATGRAYGSPHKLAAAIRNGAGTVNGKRAKKYHLVKTCLVQAF